MSLFKFNTEDQIHYFDEIISLFNSEGCELSLYATKEEIATASGLGVRHLHPHTGPETLIEVIPECVDHEGHFYPEILIDESAWNPSDEMLLNCMKSMESFCILKVESVKGEDKKYHISDEAKELIIQATEAGMKVEIQPKGEVLNGAKIVDNFLDVIGRLVEPKV